MTWLGAPWWHRPWLPARGAVALVVSAGLVGATSCGGANEGGSGSARPDRHDDYVASVTAVLEGQGATEDVAGCVANALVHALSVPRLDEVTSPEQLAELDAIDPAALGTPPSDTTARTFEDRLVTCEELPTVGDQALVFTTTLARQEGLSDTQMDCIFATGELNADMVDDYLVASYLHHPAGVSPSETVAVPLRMCAG